VVVAVELVEPVTPDVPPVEPLVEPEAPIELVPPDDDVSLLVVPVPVPGVVVPLLPLVVPPVEPEVPPVEPEVPPAAPLVLPEGDVPLLGAGVVVDELEDEVVGAGVVSSRLVQAPSETAAMSASAAQEVRDAFIGKLLEGLFEK
jgi:hypothetical protein